MDLLLDTSRIPAEDKRRITRFFAQKLLAEREAAYHRGYLKGVEAAPQSVIQINPAQPYVVNGPRQVQQVLEEGHTVVLDDGSRWRRHSVIPVLTVGTTIHILQRSGRTGIGYHLGLSIHDIGYAVDFLGR
jgi:hypothetical protein